jgi:benzaldehyde dehydrogenase (NAD)
MIQFTGSTSAGRNVAEAAGRHLKKVSLELGGKNSLIILDDADIDLAIANAAWGVYLHQGQICMSTGKILVHRKIHDRFVDKLIERAKRLITGDPNTREVALGPMINASQRDHVSRVVAAAVKAGASLATGGAYRDLFYEPTVLTGVTASNPAFSEEIFGPVAVVTSFDTDEEAIDLANRTEYGLSAGIITSDVGRGLQLGERLHVGLLHINDQTVNDEVINPFGGVGASGNGASVGGPAIWEAFTHWQWLTVKGQAPSYPV